MTPRYVAKFNLARGCNYKFYKKQKKFIDFDYLMLSQCLLVPLPKWIANIECVRLTAKFSIINDKL